MRRRLRPASASRFSSLFAGRRPAALRGDVPKILSGVLTLSTCSNVCILTDYPFSLNMTASAGAGFDYDFSRAMGTLPLSGGFAPTPNPTYAPAEVDAAGQRHQQHPA